MAKVLNDRVVKLTHAALDDSAHGIVLRGVIDQETFRNLLTDDYQREALPSTATLQRSLVDAYLTNARPPDVVLGMRGGLFESDRHDNYTLQNPVYIIDGLQRISSAITALQIKGDIKISLGAMVLFDTTKEIERDLFRTLNMDRLRVSASKLLANEREEHPGILMLYGLTHNDKEFPLYKKVTWSQRMVKGDLITALSLAIVVANLHGHRGSGVRRISGVRQAVQVFDRLEKEAGLQSLRNNTKVFFEIVDECWGLRMINYRETAAQVKTGFLKVLAKIMSEHHDFWDKRDPKKLFVDADMRRKLKQFDLRDGAVISLAGSGGKSLYMLASMLIDHLNSGKRKENRLKARDPGAGIQFGEEIDDDRDAA